MENIDVRPEVAAFALLMEARLKANDHKPGWKNDDPYALSNRVSDEHCELLAALQEHMDSAGDPSPRTGPTVAKECADVANFAMMVADVCGALPAPAPSQPGEEEAAELLDAIDTLGTAAFDAGMDSANGDRSRAAERWEEAKAGVRRLISSMLSRARSEQKRIDAGICKEVERRYLAPGHFHVDESAAAPACRRCAAEIGKGE